MKILKKKGKLAPGLRLGNVQKESFVFESYLFRTLPPQPEPLGLKRCVRKHVPVCGNVYFVVFFSINLYTLLYNIEKSFNDQTYL